MGEPAFAMEPEPEPEVTHCGVCEVSVLELDWRRCRVCQKVVCPSCDIRFKKPDKPACARHAEED